MENNQVHKKRYKFINGRYRPIEVSKRRVERRSAVFEIVQNKNIALISKVDEIIDYFQKLYEGERYYGMTKDERRELFIRCGGVCMWCKDPLTLGEFTKEHITPLAEGGTDDPDNLGIAHLRCNNHRDGTLMTHGGYLIESLRRYNPVAAFLLDDGYPQASLDHDHE